MNIFGSVGPSGQDDEKPTPAAELIVILARVPGFLKASRHRAPGRRPPRRAPVPRRAPWRSAAPPPARPSTAAAVPAEAGAPALETPTAAAELTVILRPYPSGRSRDRSRENKTGKRPRRWTRPPGADPP